MKEICKALFVIIGTMIGAGFASGQEIWLFFNAYGNWGIIGIILACSLTGFLIYRVLQIMQKNQINTYAELLETISSKRILNHIISIIISLFLLISFYVMVAGMSAYFHQEFGFPVWICSIIMTLLCYVTLQKDMKGIVIVNSILIPSLILFIMYLGGKNFSFSMEYLATKQIETHNSWSWLLSSVLYASYNSIILVPMLVELKQYINSKNKAKILAILCAIMLSTLGICLFFLLLRNETAYQLELPMLEIVKSFSNVHRYLYGAVVAVAIFTSAISAGYGFLKNEVAQKRIKKGNIAKRENAYYQKLLLGMCLFAPIIANFGFSNLVSKLYPVFGVLGLLQMIGILRKNY